MKPAWAAVAAGASFVIISLWTPDVEPIMPERTAVVGDTLALGEPDTAGSSDGFVTRPLFLTSRRPIVSLAVAVRIGPTPTVYEDAVEQIEGVTLLGIFSSGDASGVIVSEKGVGHRRIFEGDHLQGWELVGVESGVRFFREGKTARLDMQIVSKVAVAAEAKQLDDRTNPGAASAGTAGTVEEAPSFVPTFENMYQSRAARDRGDPMRVTQSQTCANKVITTMRNEKMSRGRGLVGPFLSALRCPLWSVAPRRRRRLRQCLRILTSNC